jgi:D-sedoheptulose 7-phosphate isomerase
MVEKSNKKLDSFQSDPSLSILIKTEKSKRFAKYVSMLIATTTKY